MSYLLKKNELINETYEVQCHVGQGAFGEVYRVKHKFLGLQVLKVFKSEYAARADIEVLTEEAKILSQLTHPNIVRVFETNAFQKDGQKHYFITMGFVSGETLAQLLARKGSLPLPLALSFMQDILSGLALVHGNDPPIVHRDISPDNILLSYAGEKPRALLSDFGLAQFSDYNQELARGAGKYIYMAPECFWDVHLPVSDVFSVGVVFYRMIAGMEPWVYDFESVKGSDNPEDFITMINVARKQTVPILAAQHENLPARLENVLTKALALNLENRYLNAGEFLADLKVLLPSAVSSKSFTTVAEPDPRAGDNEDGNRGYRVRIAGQGFDQIAGMDELKELLYHDVILPLQEKDLYAQYRLSIPNGMLFYGPPGCGKTFIAEKFAEEVGFTFFPIKPSDVASTYIHGTQEKIKEIFEKARKDAPSLIFIDEVDALMPSRDSNLQHNYSSEVNEFLAQMTECGKDSVFLIAATNRPDKIDSAIIRTGRLDKLFYLAPPDKIAREKMFNLHLSGRPLEDVSPDKLAEMTDNYIASDIKFLVDEAARQALKERGPVKHEHLEEAIKKHRPSLSHRQLKVYEKFKDTRSFD